MKVTKLLVLLLALLALVVYGCSCEDEEEATTATTTTGSNSDEDDADADEDIEMVDINSATLEELDELPGISLRVAQRIIDYREENGGFDDVDAIDDVQGIGPSAMAKIRDLIVAEDYEGEDAAETDDEAEEDEEAADDEAAAGEKLNINTASAAALEAALPGIGASYAARIVEYREANGDFKSIDDVTNVRGIGEAKLANFRDLICLEGGVNELPEAAASSSSSSSSDESSSSTTSSGSLVNINTAGKAELETVTGIGPSMAGNIIAYREANGDFESIDDLVNVTRIGPATVEKLRPQITVD